jgi:Flp pilus assembly protein TadG
MNTRSIVQRMLDSAMSLALKQKGARGEEGSAIMETAMSIIILLTFMFGVMEVGFALYSYHVIAEAAREGTRYAIVRGASAGAACGSYSSYDCMASSTDIQNYVQNLGLLANMTVAPVWSTYTSGKTCPTTPPCNSPGNLITVTVTYNFPLNVPFIPPHSYAMTSTAAMIIQN